MSVPFNANPASTYTYTVQALCATATYNSNQSSGAVLYTYGAPSAPTTITLNNIANNIYVGTEGRPTITLAWSGASAGMYAIITKYEVYLDGNLAFTVNTGNTYGSQVVTASGVYTIKVIASSTLTSTSISRTVYTIGVPTFAGYTVKPSGKTNGNVTYAWTGSSLANTHLLLSPVAYKNGNGNINLYY